MGIKNTFKYSSIMGHLISLSELNCSQWHWELILQDLNFYAVFNFSLLISYFICVSILFPQVRYQPSPNFLIVRNQ